MHSGRLTFFFCLAEKFVFLLCLPCHVKKITVVSRCLSFCEFLHWRSFSLVWFVLESGRIIFHPVTFVAVVSEGGVMCFCHAIISHTHSPSALITLVRWQVCVRALPRRRATVSRAPSHLSTERLSPHASLEASSCSLSASLSWLRCCRFHCPPDVRVLFASQFSGLSENSCSYAQHSTKGWTLRARQSDNPTRCFTACWKWFILATVNLYYVPHSLVLGFDLLLWRLCYAKCTIARAYCS